MPKELPTKQYRDHLEHMSLIKFWFDLFEGLKYWYKFWFDLFEGLKYL